MGFSRIVHNRGEAVDSMEDFGARAVSDIAQVADCFAERACLGFFEGEAVVSMWGFSGIGVYFGLQLVIWSL